MKTTLIHRAIRPTKPDALFADGGTGDATIMLSQPLADIGADAEFIYLDNSDAAHRACPKSLFAAIK